MSTLNSFNINMIDYILVIDRIVCLLIDSNLPNEAILESIE